MDFSAIKAVAFDAFGTLVEIGDKRRPFARLAKEALVDTTRSPMTERMDLVAMSQVCGLDLAPDIFVTLEDDLKLELASTHVYPEAKDVLLSLRKRGIRTAVASNLAEPYAVPIREQLGSLLDVACYSFEVGTVKPDRAFYVALSDLLQLDPEQILMVGDTMRCDYLGATSAGLKALHLDRRGNAPTEFSLVTIEDLRGVLSAIEK
jgi:FMN phosphatase YigB (HAD superfamily)